MNSKSKSKNTKKKKEIGNFCYDFVKVTGALPTLLWLRPRIIHMGKKHSLKDGFMASANHCSFLDPVIIHCVFWKRRVYSLATKDLYSTKLRKWFFNRMHCIEVDKENFSLNSFHEVVKQLKRGKVVSIFPEGRVNFSSDDVLTFKSGVILMAHTANVPIVPVYILPAKKWYNRRTAVVGEPINIRDICGRMPSTEDISRAASYVHEKEEELKAYYHEKYDKNKQKESEKETVNQ